MTTSRDSLDELLTIKISQLMIRGEGDYPSVGEIVDAVLPEVNQWALDIIGEDEPHTKRCNESGGGGHYSCVCHASPYNSLRAKQRAKLLKGDIDEG